MSTEDKEDAKRIATECVQEHLEISEKTRVRTSIRNAILVGCAIVSSTAAVCSYLNKISNGQDRIEAGLNHKVSFSTLTQWVDDLDHANRQTVPLLVVPRIVSPDEQQK